MIRQIKTWLYWKIFGNGLAYRSPWWYAVADFLADDDCLIPPPK